MPNRWKCTHKSVAAVFSSHHQAWGQVDLAIVHNGWVIWISQLQCLGGNVSSLHAESSPQELRYSIPTSLWPLRLESDLLQTEVPISPQRENIQEPSNTDVLWRGHMYMSGVNPECPLLQRQQFIWEDNQSHIWRKACTTICFLSTYWWSSVAQDQLISEIQLSCEVAKPGDPPGEGET